MDNELIVLVKKYFDKVNGNTYHSVQFRYKGKIYHSGKTYGYERQYEQTFIEMLSKEMAFITIDKFIADNNVLYLVIENCKAKELKEIHEYK